jgi:hypothetical protein
MKRLRRFQMVFAAVAGALAAAAIVPAVSAAAPTPMAEQEGENATCTVRFGYGRDLDIPSYDAGNNADIKYAHGFDQTYNKGDVINLLYYPDPETVPYLDQGGTTGTEWFLRGYTPDGVRVGPPGTTLTNDPDYDLTNPASYVCGEGFWGSQEEIWLEPYSLNGAC